MGGWGKFDHLKQFEDRGLWEKEKTMKRWGRTELGSRRQKGWRQRRRGQVRNDKKPVLICCSLIRVIKLSSLAKRESGGPSGVLCDTPRFSKISEL